MSIGRSTLEIGGTGGDLTQILPDTICGKPVRFYGDKVIDAIIIDPDGANIRLGGTGGKELTTITWPTNGRVEILRVHGAVYQYHHVICRITIVINGKTHDVQGSQEPDWTLNFNFSGALNFVRSGSKIDQLQFRDIVVL